MRKAIVLPALLGACACAPTGLPEPDWAGPPVNICHRGHGGLWIELVAPTAGHEFTLGEVRRDGARVDVCMRHRRPSGELVAQVVTPIAVDVPAAQLGDARTVSVWIASDGDPRRLVMTLARR
ncbi:MAG TPA: hypothetical protein ENI87_01405 [bacterium]|nr:hypothetical protein [bacterium]